MEDPFISTQDLVDYLGRGDPIDPGMVFAVDAACDVCRDVSGQALGRTIGGTITLDGNGHDALLLPERPVSQAGTVFVNGTAITDYSVNPNGLLFRGTAGVNPRPAWPDGRQNVRVVYDHGFESVPNSIRMVALSIAARLVVQGPALQETVGDASVRYGVNSTDLTNGERRILEKYRQIR